MGKESDIDEVDKSHVLFTDDNAGNLELAEDSATVYQPQAGPNSVGLNLIELQCLLNGLSTAEPPEDTDTIPGTQPRAQATALGALLQVTGQTNLAVP